MIIAINRMQNGAKQANGHGLLRYADKAVKLRGKI